jgi:hypothetical protein
VKLCESCQKGKQIKVPLGNVEESIESFQVTTMYITGPYCLTPTPQNKYVLKFFDHFRKYAEAIPNADQSPEICVRIYATQIIARP